MPCEAVALTTSQILGRILALQRPWSTSSTSMPQTIANITNTSAPVEQAFNSQFQHARNVDIRGGQFTTESAPRMVTNFTINIPRMDFFNLSLTSNLFRV